MGNRYEKIARELVERVREINPEAKVIQNWEHNPEIVINLIRQWDDNLPSRARFLERPFSYIDVRNFY